MKAKTKQRAASQTGSVRVSVTFPRDQYDLLEQLAREKKVSVAWVARDAAEKYLEEQWSLFGRSKAK